MTINYTYDGLSRLTAADYSSGDYYHYTYDSVGNRLNETTAKGETAYTYDTANRLTSVNGQAVQWDDNGNMLADSQAVYTYNTANKLVGVTKGTSSIVYAYSGLGDRLRQIADGVTTDYTLDINAGLTQVLQDGKQSYLYGNSRIAQIAETQTGYFLPDALGSMRQMTDPSADLTLARTYDPYGNVVSSSGAGETVYGYTGEMQSGGLVHLRARDYASQLGRFPSRDTWEGEIMDVSSHNKYLYADANPIIYIDPTGFYYDRQAAVEFAKAHDQDAVFPDEGYYQFLESGDKQCTIFVSSALSIGKYPTSAEWPGYENTKLSLYNLQYDTFLNATMKEGMNYSDAWVNTPKLYKYLNNGNNLVLTPPHNTPQEDPLDLDSDDWKNWISNVTLLIEPGDVVFYVNEWDVKHYGGNFGHVAMVVGWGYRTNRYHDIIIEEFFRAYDSAECAQDRFIDNLIMKNSLRPLVVDRSGAIKYNEAKAIDDTAQSITNDEDNIIRRMDIIHISQ